MAVPKMPVKVFLPAYETAVANATGNPNAPAGFLRMTCELSDTNKEFKLLVIETLKQKGVLTRLTGIKSSLNLFHLTDRATGRVLLDSKTLMESFYLFEDPPDDLATADPLEICLVEKVADREERKQRAGRGKTGATDSGAPESPAHNRRTSKLFPGKPVGLGWDQEAPPTVTEDEVRADDHVSTLIQTANERRSADVSTNTPKRDSNGMSQTAMEKDINPLRVRAATTLAPRTAATATHVEQSVVSDPGTHLGRDRARTSAMAADTSARTIDALAQRAAKRLQEKGDALQIPDQSYEVVKVNHRGRKQERVLRLTGTSIHNVRSGKVTACHTYADVFCVTLADSETLVISFLNDQDFTYISPIAMQIVQEINRRLALRRHNEKRTFTYNLANLAVKYQEKLHRQMEDDLEMQADDSVSFKEQVRENVLLHVLRDGAREVKAAHMAGKLEHIDTHSAGSMSSTAPTPLGGAASSTAAALMSNPATRRNVSARKLQFLTGTTEDERLQETVDRILLDRSTEEGRARSRFLKNFSVLEKKPAQLLDTMRQFMDSLKSYMETKRGDDIRRFRSKPVKAVSSEEKNSQQDADADADVDVAMLIERSLETHVTLPVYIRVVKCLTAMTEDREAVLVQKVRELRFKDQRFFGIQPEQVSSTNWSSACYEMSLLGKRALPQEKLEVLLSTARAIYNSYNWEKNRLASDEHELKVKGTDGQADSAEGPDTVVSTSSPSADSANTHDAPDAKDSARKTSVAAQAVDEIVRNVKNYFLAADEFFPVFVYVLCNANLSRFEVNKVFMWGLCDRASLSGEGGYYLTVYEAALEYIYNLDVKDLEHKFALSHPELHQAEAMHPSTQT